MSVGKQIFRGLLVGWRFLLRDKTAIQLIDASNAGVWFSFIGPLIAFPIYALHFVLSPYKGAVDVGGLHYGLIFILAYCLSRLIWPVMITVIAPMHRKEPQMGAYIAAYNWSVPFQMVILFAAGIFISISGFKPSTGAMIAICSYGLVMVYHMFILGSLWGLRMRPTFMLSLSEFFIVKFALGMVLLRLG